MKKLTAGIFATILGVTAMGAADAAVTSKGYVDAALATKASASEVATLSSTVSGHTTQITNLQTASDTHALKSNVYTKSEVNSALDLKADKSLVGTLPEGTNASTVVGYVDEKTADIASSSTVSNLVTRVETIEGDYITATELSDSQDAQNLTITAAYQADDATTLQAAKDYADTKVYNDTQVKADILANTQAIGVIEADYLKANDIANLATKSYADTAATNAANGKDAAISAAQTAAATADGKAVAAQEAAEAAQGTADDALAKAEANEIAITNLEAFDNSIKTATENAADGTYALTMKKNAQTGAMEFDWELIQRDGTLN